LIRWDKVNCGWCCLSRSIWQCSAYYFHRWGGLFNGLHYIKLWGREVPGARALELLADCISTLAGALSLQCVCCWSSFVYAALVFAGCLTLLAGCGPLIVGGDVVLSLPLDLAMFCILLPQVGWTLQWISLYQTQREGSPRGAPWRCLLIASQH
jgi:hypothetical protein